jgi:predicted O-methyltransferase YrrM
MKFNSNRHVFKFLIIPLAALLFLFVVLNPSIDLKSRVSSLINGHSESNHAAEQHLKESVLEIKDANEKSIKKLESKLLDYVRREIEDEKQRRSVDNLKDRSELVVILNKFKWKTMIEIGVQQGAFADLLLSKWQDFEHYYGVDLWQEQRNYVDGTNVKDTEQEKNYNMTYTALTEKYGKARITLVRNYSTLALPLFKKKSIDFIYIDARHDYCGCSEDMINYYPILKCGGLFAGHDYQYESQQVNNDWGVCANGTRAEGAVKKAVLDFAKQKSIKRVYSTRESSFASWYFFKECQI